MLGSSPAIMETVTVRVRWDHVGEEQSGHLGRAQSTTQLWSHLPSSTQSSPILRKTEQKQINIQRLHGREDGRSFEEISRTTVIPLEAMEWN